MQNLLSTRYIIFPTPQIKLEENFEVYFNSTLKTKKSLRTGTRMTPYQQSFEINIGTQSINVNSVGTNRQFAFLEVSLVYNRKDQHKTTCNNYNAEIAAAKIQSLKIENVLIRSTLTSEIKCDVDGADDAYWLYVQFVAFSCNGCCKEPLTDYAENEVYQELVRQEKYLTSSDKRLYVGLRRSKG